MNLMERQPMDTRFLRTLGDLTLGERMRLARKRAHVETEDMCAELDIVRNTVSSWETDRTVPNKPALFMWALVCGVELDWLTGDLWSPERIVQRATREGAIIEVGGTAVLETPLGDVTVDFPSGFPVLSMAEVLEAVGRLCGMELDLSKPLVLDETNSTIHVTNLKTDSRNRPRKGARTKPPTEGDTKWYSAPGLVIPAHGIHVARVRAIPTCLVNDLLAGGGLVK